MRDGTKHDTVKYASIRVERLKRRIDGVLSLIRMSGEQYIMSDGRLARDRLRLDRLSLQRWEATLAKANAKANAGAGS